MIIKRTSLLIFLSTIIIGLSAHAAFLYVTTVTLNGLEHHSNEHFYKKHSFLIINMARSLGGSVTHSISLCATLRQAGYDAILLIGSDTDAEKYARKNNVTFYSSPVWNMHRLGATIYSWALSKSIATICKQRRITIVQLGDGAEARAASYARKQTGIPFKVIAERHCALHKTFKFRYDIDGFICVNQAIADDVKKIIKDGFDHGKILVNPPFYNHQAADMFKSPEEGCKDFFKKHFNINTENLPIISCIANFYRDNCKNHALLLHALKTIIIDRQKPCILICAGEGPTRKSIEKLAKELEIEKYIHLVGFTPLTKEILYFSQFHVLPSKFDAQPMAHVESALMHRATIGGTETGAVDIIIDGKTGLLFDNDNVDSLTEKIMLLLDNPGKAKAMGEQGFVHVTTTLSNENKLRNLETLYEKL